MTAYDNIGTYSDGTLTIKALAKECRYGSKSFVSAKKLLDLADENPEIKTYSLPEVGLSFPASGAIGTLGTYITKANKIINGIDPSVRESNGSSGGGRGRASKIAAFVDGSNLTFSAENASGRIEKDTIILQGDVSNSFASRIAQTFREVQEGKTTTVRTMLGKPSLVAKLGDFTAVIENSDEITDELKAKCVAELAQQIQKSGDFALFGQLKDTTYSLVGGDIEAVEAWIKSTYNVEIQAEPVVVESEDEDDDEDDDEE